MSGIPDTELYFVLIGRVGRCTVWPCATPIPAEWQVAFGPDTRAQCTAYVRRHRSDAPKLVSHHR
ncbi:MbtH family NRPS accessory protein [Flexivirga caeni]|uniref:MbtH family protein n=1 Tax=Flexivirga caeni TaxID=2294115 RepID=A0A3M9MJR6_9MICO|nr:MbtH family NRPS accessory protein [Flexivirga caeni]RNI25425.1 MbtH family protein [Flexivirga caeni]